MNIQIHKSHKCFNGTVYFASHQSEVAKTRMKFSYFMPSKPPVGVLIWLSGLTCTEENFITKAGSQRILEALGLCVICPDTSPRGLTLPGEHDTDDFGSGAGFYVNATTPGYSDHYRMYSYVSEELYQLVSRDISPNTPISLSGHSMGGHGALVIGLREAGKFVSLSAFAPLAHPSATPWGQKALRGYLGGNEESWKMFDATELMNNGVKRSDQIFIDVGADDPFLKSQLRIEDFVNVSKEKGQDLLFKSRPGYDHSYYYISTFIEEHLVFHTSAAHRARSATAKPKPQ